MNWTIRLMLMIFAFVLSSCSVLDSIIGSKIINESEIPSNIVGIDHDLWSTFVELTNIPDCQLPCFWGLAIGETSLDETLDFLEATEFNRSQSRSQYAELSRTDYLINSVYWLIFTKRTTPDNANIGDVSYNFGFDDGQILNYIDVRMRNPNGWLPEELNPLTLNKMIVSNPIDPIIFTGSPSNTTYNNFSLYVNYTEYRWALRYVFDFSAYPDICIDTENTQEIMLSIRDDASNLTQTNGVSIVSIEESSLLNGISSDAFVQFFRDNPNSCLDITQYP